MTLKDTTQNFNDEFNRVMSNPENLIMSDSLDGVLDFAVAEDPEVWGSSNFTCHLNFKDNMVAGALKSFSIKKNHYMIVTVCDDDAAIHLLNAQQLVGYVCKSIYGETVTSIETNCDVEIQVNFNDEQQTAEVTVIIPRRTDK
jgi:hypothetical protein